MAKNTIMGWMSSRAHRMAGFLKQRTRSLITLILIVRYRYWRWRDKKISNYVKRLRIMSMDDTVDYIVRTGCSCSRYGDGEFAVMAGGCNGFQKVDLKLAERLREVLLDPVEGLLVCVPSSLVDVRPLTLDLQLFFLGCYSVLLKSSVMPFVSTEMEYGDAQFTRFYMNRKNKEGVAGYVTRLKLLWNGEDLLVVEGKFSRLGVGNDLFSNARSIKRIICPKENAFDAYDRILACIKEKYHGELVILALGMTATVLAYDLTKLGIRALDLGHIDIEYEWFRMGAAHKVPIPDKYVNECADGACDTPSDDVLYKRQIIADCSA